MNPFAVVLIYQVQVGMTLLKQGDKTRELFLDFGEEGLILKHSIFVSGEELC